MRMVQPMCTNINPKQTGRRANFNQPDRAILPYHMFLEFSVCFPPFQVSICLPPMSRDPRDMMPHRGCDIETHNMTWRDTDVTCGRGYTAGDRSKSSKTGDRSKTWLSS